MVGKKEKIMLIASYKREYSEMAISKIQHLIQKNKPDRIIVIKAVEERATQELVSANVGIEEKLAMLRSIREEKKIRADELASDLIKTLHQMDVPIEVCFRMGERISQEIITEFKRLDADLLVIHDTKKGTMDKIFGSCTTEEILERLDCNKVVKL